jgi:hypothetical protein
MEREKWHETNGVVFVCNRQGRQMSNLRVKFDHHAAQHAFGVDSILSASRLKLTCYSVLHGRSSNANRWAAETIKIVK